MKNQTITLRSDHLKAMLEFVVIHLADGYAVLDIGDNENALEIDEQFNYTVQCLKTLQGMTVDGNCELLVSKK